MRTTSKVLPRAPLLLVSLLLSIMLWLYVQVQEYPVKAPPASYLVDIKLQNVPDNLVASDPGQMRFFPKGSLEDLQMIQGKDISAYIDMKDAKVGTDLYPVHLVDKGQAAVTWQPTKPQARITVEHKISRSVRVKVQPAGELENADYLFLPLATTTDPQYVDIVGPQSAVARVTTVRAILDLTQVTPGQSYKSDIELLEDNDRPAPDSVKPDVTTVEIHPAIAVGLESLRLPVRASYTGKPAAGFVVKELVVSPRDVLVRGKPDVLNGMTYLETEPAIDVAGLSQSMYFTVTPKLPPEGIALSGQPTITVQVVIEPEPAVPPTSTSNRKRTAP